MNVKRMISGMCAIVVSLTSVMALPAFAELAFHSNRTVSSEDDDFERTVYDYLTLKETKIKDSEYQKKYVEYKVDGIGYANETWSQRVIEGNVVDIYCDGYLFAFGGYGEDGKSEIKIPSKVKGLPVKVIRENEFQWNPNLKKVTLPDSIEAIDYQAFYNCSSLKSITIPKSVKRIGRWALGYTSKWDEKADDFKKVSGFTIRCYKNSAGEKYAIDNGFDYELIDSNTTPISKAKVSVKNKTYTGKKLKPSTTVKLNGKILKKGTDYTVSYKNNKNCGKGNVIVTGIGKYQGRKSATFIIKPAKTVLEKVVSNKTKQINVLWKKSAGGVSGYQVLIARNKSFNIGRKAYAVKKAASASKTITGLKGKTTYYVKGRAYKTIGKTKHYGAWSAVKKVKCK